MFNCNESHPDDPKPYNYFATPDGEDFFSKLWCAFQPASLFAFWGGTLDVALYSHPPTYMGALGRYIAIAWPIFGATTAFVATSNIMGNIRKKDDELNWFVGGMAAGAIVGVWRKSFMTGMNMGVLIGTGLGCKKYCVKNGYAFMYPEDAEKRKMWGNVWITKEDWTVYPELPRNWTTK